MNYSDDDDGLPDASFTKDELAAGVQHAARNGYFLGDEISIKSREEGKLFFASYFNALKWAKENPGKAIVRDADGLRFRPKDRIAIQKDCLSVFLKEILFFDKPLNIELIKQILNGKEKEELKYIKKMLQNELSRWRNEDQWLMSLAPSPLNSKLKLYSNDLKLVQIIVYKLLQI